MTPSKKLAAEIAAEIDESIELSLYRYDDTIATIKRIVESRIESVVKDAERWSFVEAFNLHSGSPHMDGTYAFVLGGSLGRARTVEEAIAARMEQREWKGKRGDQ